MTDGNCQGYTRGRPVSPRGPDRIDSAPDLGAPVKRDCVGSTGIRGGLRDRFAPDSGAPFEARCVGGKWSPPGGPIIRFAPELAERKAKASRRTRYPLWWPVRSIPRRDSRTCRGKPRTRPRSRRRVTTPVPDRRSRRLDQGCPIGLPSLRVAYSDSALELPCKRQKLRIASGVEDYRGEDADKRKVTGGMFKTSGSARNRVILRRLGHPRGKIDADASACNVDDQEAAIIESKDARSGRD